MMKQLMLLMILSSMAVLAGNTIVLEPLKQNDLSSEDVVKAEARSFAEAGQVSRDAVTYSWPLDAGSALELAAKPHITESKGYWFRVSPNDFVDGIELPITDSNALVRINPVSNGESFKGDAIDPMDLVLINPEGRSFSGGSGMEMLLTAEQVEAARGDLFPAGTSAFRISPALGSGELLLYADNLTTSVDYMIHVQERDSVVGLRVATGNDNYLAGQSLGVDLALSNNGRAVSFSKVNGRLVSPTGATYALNFDRSGRNASAILAQDADATRGLWQVEVTAFGTINGVEIRRDARTSFSYALPTARFSGKVEVLQSKAAMAADLDIVVGTSGRYEVRGILFGTAADGSLQPIAMTHSADWLNAGDQSLRLSFDQSLVEASGLQAPFEVKDLRLIHQNRMGLLHRQQDGFRISGDR